MANVSLENLVKTYSDKAGTAVPAVKSINLEIADGEFMVLVGPSGCGKSTTLRMIAGLEEISGGTISIAGRVINDVLPKDRDIAMVFQNYALYPHMTVRENLAFGLTLRKIPRVEINRRVQEAADLLGLADLLDRKPKALSGGQRQRVAVGRAIVRQPKVFLFDEPLSNLDAKMRVTMRTEIAKLHDRLNATMIYVTHDQVEAMTMGDRICVMRDGHIMQVATPLELYHRPANLYVAGFIGSPGMNFLPGRIENGVFIETTPTGVPPARIPLDDALKRRAQAHGGKPVIFGLRPEDIIELTADQPHTGPTLDFTLTLAEPMGAETYLHLTTGAHPFVARIRSHTVPTPGQTIRLGLDLSMAHLFDPVTENVLA